MTQAIKVSSSPHMDQERPSVSASEIVQLPLDISMDPLYRWENFYISPSNEEAIMLLQRWPNWESSIQLIYGPENSGKTHIAHLWRQESRASFVDDSVLKLEFLAEYVAQNPFLIVDNADAITCYEGLFHLYNLIKENEGFLLLTAKTPPALWNINLPDLKSRMRSIPATEIKAPTDGLLKALLIKRFSDGQLKVQEPVIDFILKHIERSYGAIQHVAEALSHTSLEQRRNLTLPLVKQVLGV